jgi:hypothetical protein
VASGHGFMRGLHLRVDSALAKPTVRLHKRFRRRPKHSVHGGGWPATGERRQGVRLKKNNGKAGDCFLTKRRSLGGRENGGEVDGGGDRRRRPSFKGGGGELKWAQENR